MERKLLLCAASLFMLFSCTGEDSTPVQNDPLPLVSKTVSINWSGQPETSVYEYKDQRLLSIVSDMGNERHFKYSGDQIIEIERVDEFGDVVVDYFTYDTQGRVSEHREISAAFGRKDVYTYSGNEANVIQYFGDTQNQNDPILFATLTFQNGELATVQTSDAAGVTTYAYTYDAKNNPFKNVTGYAALNSLLTLTAKGVFQNVTQNTQSRDGMTNVVNKTYQYSVDNYPVKALSSDPIDGDSATIHYYY